MKILGRTLLVLSLFALSVVAVTRPAYAATCSQGELTSSGCSCTGSTQEGRCIYTNGQVPQTGNTDSVFGKVDAPPGVAQYNNQVTGTGEKIGLIIFFSNIIRIATIIAGVIVFINFILAGYAFLTSDGSAKVNEEVKNQLTYSVIGLVIIVASYTIIAIISLVLFGKADFILNPTITGPTP